MVCSVCALMYFEVRFIVCMLDVSMILHVLGICNRVLSNVIFNVAVYVIYLVLLFCSYSVGGITYRQICSTYIVCSISQYKSTPTTFNFHVSESVDA